MCKEIHLCSSYFIYQNSIVVFFMKTTFYDIYKKSVSVRHEKQFTPIQCMTPPTRTPVLMTWNAH